LKSLHFQYSLYYLYYTSLMDYIVFNSVKIPFNFQSLNTQEPYIILTFNNSTSANVYSNSMELIFEVKLPLPNIPLKVIYHHNEVIVAYKSHGIHKCNELKSMVLPKINLIDINAINTHIIALLSGGLAIYNMSDLCEIIQHIDIAFYDCVGSICAEASVFIYSDNKVWRISGEIVASILDVGIHKICLADCSEKYVCIVNEENEITIHDQLENTMSIQGSDINNAQIISIHIINDDLILIFADFTIHCFAIRDESAALINGVINFEDRNKICFSGKLLIINCQDNIKIGRIVSREFNSNYYY